jgi:hypothetical protein
VPEASVYELILPNCPLQWKESSRRDERKDRNPKEGCMPLRNQYLSRIFYYYYSGSAHNREKEESYPSGE